MNIEERRAHLAGMQEAGEIVRRALLARYCDGTTDEGRPIEAIGELYQAIAQAMKVHKAVIEAVEPPVTDDQPDEVSP